MQPLGARPRRGDQNNPRGRASCARPGSPRLLLPALPSPGGHEAGPAALCPGHPRAPLPPGVPAQQQPRAAIFSGAEFLPGTGPCGTRTAGDSWGQLGFRGQRRAPAPGTAARRQRGR